MLRLVTFSALLCLGLAQNGYDYNRPGKTFGNGKPFTAGTTPGRASNTGTAGYTGTAVSNGFSTPTVPSFTNQQGADEGYPTAGTGPTPNFPVGNTGYPSGPNQGFQGNGQNYPESDFGNALNGNGYQGQNNGFQGNYPQQAGNQPSNSFSGNGQSGYSSQGQNSFSSQGQGGLEDNGLYEGGDFSAIPGEPDRDYPILSEIPQTSFRCDAQPYPGYYADVEARCQVFHVCANNRTFDFLCPNGTIFSQEVFVCVWWNQFDCNSAPGLFDLNANLYDYSITGSQNTGTGGYSQNAQGGTYSNGQGDITGATGVQPGYSTGQNAAGYPGPSSNGFTGPAPTGFTAAQGPYPTSTSPTAPQNGFGSPSTTFTNGNGYDTNTPQAATASYPTSPNGGYSRKNSNGNGYPSGRPNGPSFSAGRPGQTSDSGFPPKPNREYLPPRN